MARLLHFMIFTLIPAASAYAEELLQPVALTTLAADNTLPAAELVDDATLRIEAAPGQPLQLLFELEDPGISSPVYALKGMIRYEDVAGAGYLQLDNHFGDRGTYFTRSLAEAGPLAKLTGSSGWRAFVLPFYAHSGDPAGSAALVPERLSLSLYLSGSGTVFLRNVGLYQYAAHEDPLGVAPWLSTRAAAMLGAVGGILVGLWGALIGVLVSRGKARGFVLGSATVLLGIGIVSLGAGVAAVVADQPYAVFYPLLLAGGIITIVVGSLRRTLPQRYEALELRRMQAMDS